MRRRLVVVVPTLLLIVLPIVMAAQPPARIVRVGVLCPISCREPSVEAFRQALSELGYVDRRNIVFEFQEADGRIEQLREQAAELVRRKVDVVFTTWGTAAALAAKQATTDIPIVMAAAGDPVAAGLVANLTRPGGNLTGLSSLALELEGKRLELLKELVPDLARVAVLWDPANPYSELAFKREATAAQTVGVKLYGVRVRSLRELEAGLTEVTRERIKALSIQAYLPTLQGRDRIVEFAAKNQIVAVYPLREYVEAGGLIAYGASLADISRRAAGYVDKVLRGARPGDLPVEQPTKFEVVVNLKTAQALRLAIPQSVLLRADQVIQ